MRWRNRLVRLFRAVSGKGQRDFAGEAEIHPSLLAQYEVDNVEPGPEHLARLARGAGLTVEGGEQVLRLADTLRQPRRRAGQGMEGLLSLLEPRIADVYRRVLKVSLPAPSPISQDQHQAAELWPLLSDLSEDRQAAVVRWAEEYQSWALMEVVCAESVAAASQDLERAASLARLSCEIADHVRGPEGWRNRVRGYAAAHGPNVLRVAGELKAAEAAFEPAKRLWLAGSDPDGLLDPGRLLDLEASLRRAQRRFEEALALLDKARKMGRCPGRILVKKGFTLEAMGEYERAVDALLEADPLLDRETEPRLWYKQRANLAVNYCHLGRYREAAERVAESHPVAVELGDEIELLRFTWLRGRIAAGLGRPEEAQALLAQAREQFAGRKMWYDVALALLEEAALRLDKGETAEVKALAEDLAKVFEAQGVHREALAALRLFQEAAEREEATADLARRVLRYLFRARHDPDLRFTGS